MTKKQSAVFFLEHGVLPKTTQGNISVAMLWV